MRYILSLILCVFVACFVACGDSTTSSAQSNPIQSKNPPLISFLPNQSIDSDTTMIIFGSNNCASCTRLKDLMAKSEALSIALRDYHLYYINISEGGEHIINIDDSQKALSTQNLKDYFAIYVTPTIIFLREGRFVFGYPGFISEARLLDTIATLKSMDLSALHRDDIAHIVVESYKRHGI